MCRNQIKEIIYLLWYSIPIYWILGFAFAASLGLDIVRTNILLYYPLYFCIACTFFTLLSKMLLLSKIKGWHSFICQIVSIAVACAAFWLYSSYLGLW
jgi:hypothetical protein